jgi:predicted amidohydrolase YtcJ
MVWLSAFTLCVCLVVPWAAAQETADVVAPADLVLLGGQVITLDPDDRVTQAIAVRGNRIVALGPDAEIQRLTGPKTRVIPLQGRGVTPGFIDSHTHVESTAGFRNFWVDLHSPPLPAEPSSAAILKKLAERVTAVPPGTWVVGQGPFGPQVPPTADELTAAFPHHPVVVKYGMHQYVANRKALEMANITKLTPDPPGGRIERGEDGEPTGMLLECFELFPIAYPRAGAEARAREDAHRGFLKQVLPRSTS